MHCNARFCRDCYGDIVLVIVVQVPGCRYVWLHANCHKKTEGKVGGECREAVEDNVVIVRWMQSMLQIHQWLCMSILVLVLISGVLVYMAPLQLQFARFIDD